MATGKAVLATVGACGALAGIGYALSRLTRSSTTSAPAANAAQHTDELVRQVEPLPGPATPQEPAVKSPLLRLNRSQHDDQGTVIQSATELLEQARHHDPTITLDELTGARLAASEHSRGTFTELACIVDAELNRAERKGKSLFESLTYNDTFGKQGSKRRASTRLDPRLRHLLAARAVLSGKSRGISRGAHRFFDPRALQRMHARYRKWIDAGREGKAPPVVSCDALTLLEAWSFDLGKQGNTRCPPDREHRGPHTEAWVGPIPDVDPLRLMLMKRLSPGPMHTRLYQAARAVLLQGLQD